MWNGSIVVKNRIYELIISGKTINKYPLNTIYVTHSYIIEILGELNAKTLLIVVRDCWKMSKYNTYSGWESYSDQII